MTVVWLADLTYTQQTIAADVIPAAIGSIAAYIESTIPSLETRLFKYPEELIADFEDNSLTKPDFLFVSNYVWNATLSSLFLKEVKAKYPSIVTVMGGPNYPLDIKSREEFLIKKPYLDFYIRHEGERSASNLIEYILNRNSNVYTEPIAGVDYLDKDNHPIFGPEQDKIKDLSILKSPYLDGRLDKFFDGKLLPIIQTNRGCPFTCSFCAEGTKFYSRVGFYPIERINDEVMYIGSLMEKIRSKGGRNDLFIADSNFGMYPRDLDICRQIQKAREVYKWPEYINVATGKNAKERVLEAASIIEGAMRLSGSVQSLTPEVLKNIKRQNIDAEALAELGLRSAKTGANTYSEIIMCLPGESLNSHFSTIEKVISSGFNIVHNFQLMILPGTPMCEPDYLTKYSMNTKYRVLPRCYGFYSLFNKPIVCAEIERICVETATLPFDDYIKSRLLHLIIATYYNDSTFKAALLLLKQLNISPYKWLISIHSIILKKRSSNDQNERELISPFERFLSNTSNELWETYDDLEEFTSDPNNIKKYINGELGNNLLFSHKSDLIFSSIKTISIIGMLAFNEILLKNSIQIDNRLVEDIFSYHVSVAEELFDLKNTSRNVVLSYDIPKFINQNNFNEDILNNKNLPKKEYSYLINLHEDQIDLISRMQSIYGTDNVGTSRILSKVHLSRLFRKPMTENYKSFATERVTAQGISE